MSRGLLTLLFSLAPAYAVAQTPVVPHEFVVEGRLYKSNGQPLDDTNSEIMFELVSSTNPSCVLYRETFSGVNFSNPTDSTAVGVFALKLGAGTPVYPGVKPSFVTLFSPGPLAGDGCSVTPTPGDSRLVRVSVKNALNGNTFEAFPLTALTAVPTAIVAESANSLGGFAPSQFLQVQSAGSSALSQSNLENVFSAGNYATLTGLLAGGYLPSNPSAAVSFNGQRLTNVAAPGTSTDAVNKGYADSFLGGRAADFTGVGPAVGDGKTMVWDQSAQKWVAGNPVLAGAAGGDLSGSYPNPVIASSAVTTAKVADNAITSNKINTTGVAVNRLVATDATTGSTLTYFSCGVGEIMWWTATGWQCTTVAALAPVKTVAGKTPNASGDVPLNAADITGLGTIVTKNYGTSAGEVALLDAGGKIPAYLLPAMSAGTITGVYTTAPILGGGVTSGNVTLSLDVGTAANKIVQLNGSAQIPAVDGSLVYNVNASKIATRAVSSAAPTGAQVLGYNATLSQWEPMSTATGSVTSVVGGTGLVAVTITGGGTLNVDVGTAANKIVQLNASAQIPAVDGSLVYNVNASKIATRAVSSAAPTGAQVLGYNATLSQWEPMNAVAGTSITAGTGLIAGTISATGTINVDVGTAANKIVQLNGSAQIPAVDGSLVYNVNASKIATRAVSSAAPAGAQVLGYNATLSQWEPMNISSGFPLRAPANDQTAPPYSFSGNTQAGMFSTAINTLDFATSGTAQLHIASDGKVGIGTTSPVASLHMVRVGMGGAGDDILLDTYNTVSSSPAFTARRARGTDTAPSSVLNGDALAKYNAVGHNGSGFSDAGWMVFFAESDFNTAVNSGLGFATVNNGAVNEGMRLNSAGLLGVGTTTPKAALELAVTGTNSALLLPRDTTANRPAGNATNGMIRYNSNTNKFEGYENGAWINVVGSATPSFPLYASTSSASAPSYSFAGDTNTGLFNPASDQLALVTNGSAALVVDASGLIGVGTSAPGALLHLTRNQNASTGILIQNTATTSSAATEVSFSTSGGSSSVGAGSSSTWPWFKDRVYMDAGSLKGISLVTSGSRDIQLYTNSTERMRVDSAGRLAIGGTSPLAILDVAASGTNSAIVVPRDTTANRPAANAANGMIRYNTDTFKFEAYESGSWTNLIATGATTSFPLLAAPGTSPASAPSYSFSGSPTTGLLSQAPDSLSLASAGTARLTVDSSGIKIFDPRQQLGIYPLMITARSSSGGAGSYVNIALDNATPGSWKQALEFRNNGAQKWSFGADYFGNGTNNFSLFDHVAGTSRFFVDENGRFGIATQAPAAALDVATTGGNSAIIVPRDTTASRPSTNVNGMIRYNTSTSKFEAYENGAWTNMITAATGGTVTSITAGTGLNGGTISGAGTISIDASKVVVYGSAGFLPVADGSNLTGVSATKIGGYPVSGAAPAGGTFLGYNATNARWEATANPVSFPMRSNAADSATLPDYSFTSDTASGLWSPGSGAVALTAGGNSNLVVNTSGVTISKSLTLTGSFGGTYNPFGGSSQIPFDLTTRVVNGNAQDSSMAGSAWTVRNTALKDQSAYIGAVAQNGTNNYVPALVFGQSSGSISNNERMRLDGFGNLGIGTTSPQAGLDVATTGTLASAIIVPRDSSGNRPSTAVSGMIRYNTSLNKFEAYENGAWVNMIAPGGGTTSFPLYASSGNASAPSYSFNGATTSGFFAPSTNVVALSTSGAERLRLDASGNLGLGTTAPSGLFDLGTPSGTSFAPTTAGLIVNSGSGTNLVDGSSANTTNSQTNLHLFKGRGIAATNTNVTTTNANTVNIAGPPTAMSNQTLTNASALYIASGLASSIGTATNSYGLFANAPTGASNNYAAVFMGGNVGVGTSSPKAGLDVAATGASSALIVPRDTQANRPGTPVNGMVRYNNNTSKFEAYENGAWTNMIGGGSTFTGFSTGTGFTTQGVVTPGATIAVDVGTAVNQIVQVQSGGKLPVLDGSQLTGVNAGRLSGTPVSAVGPSDAQYLGFNGSSGAWEPRSTFLFPDVSGAPDIAFKNDSSTGIERFMGGGGGLSLVPNGSTTLTVVAGETGINTTNPQAALEVVGYGGDSAIIVPRDSTANRPSPGVNGMIRYNTSLSRLEAFEANNWFTLSNNFPMLATTPGTASAPAYSFAGNTTTGMFSYGVNALAFATAGASRMTIDASGDAELSRNGGTTFTVTKGGGLSGSPALRVRSYGNSGTPSLQFYNGSNTASAPGPSDKNNNNTTMSLEGWAYDNASTAFNSAYIRANLEEQPTSSSRTSSIEFNVIGTGAAGFSSSRMLLHGRVGQTALALNAPGNYGAILDANGTGPMASSIMIPRDTTANRPPGIPAMLRYNTSLSAFEGYTSGWNTFVMNPQITTAGNTALLVMNGASSEVLKVVSPSSYGTAPTTTASILYVASHATTGRSINAAGSVNSNGADFAEWVPYLGPTPAPEMGSILKINGSWAIVSSPFKAAFVGNSPQENETSILVSFSGQVPTYIRGPAHVGDIVVANDDHTGTAVAREHLDSEQAARAVGVVWENSEDLGLKRVNVAVGIGLAGLHEAEMRQLRLENTRLQEENAAVKAWICRQDARAPFCP